MELKDRIRKIMEDQHMTQQVFADFIGQSPATLSSIFTGRTRPTLKVVEDIKAKIPDISTEWLLWGGGSMYITHSEGSSEAVSDPVPGQEQMLNFDDPSNATPSASYQATNNQRVLSGFQQGVRNTHLDFRAEEMKIIDKTMRRVTEIRVYYDDQTYETFVPAKVK